jgi:ABC-type glycerol-3-phosphate transport system substrate-binding protein
MFVAVVVAAACGPAATPSVRGQTIEVVAVWSGAEQQRFERVLEGFERATGCTVVYTPALHRISDFLAERLRAGRVPDVAFLPQPGALRQFVRDGVVFPIGEDTAKAVRRNYSAVWQSLASVDGRLYGVWFKAANKSLIWYNVGVFERVGVVPPRDLNGLLRVARTITASGTPAFSVGGADGWTLTDWFENLYLRLAGPARYDALAGHRVSWTDESVTSTLQVMRQVRAPDFLAGGVDGALQTSYDQSVTVAFSRPPAAAMVFEGDFVGGAITGNTPGRLGTDADVFAFPAVNGEMPTVVGGGDLAVLMRRSEAGDALLAYLATPAAAAVWASAGGFVSPNQNLDLAVYPDEISRTIARSVLDAGDGFRFDLSDLQPAAFGGVADRGMRKLLQDFLAGAGVDDVASDLEAQATAAWS